MSFSLNEVEANAKRAARGAGYPWGLAEEAAKAVRWLCAQNVDGCTAMAALLDLGYAQILAQHSPENLQFMGQNTDILCPLVTGAALSDCAAQLRAREFRFGPVSFPVLLLPYAASVARQLGQMVVLDCDGIVAATEGYRLHFEGQIPQTCHHVTVRLGNATFSARTLKSRANPDPIAWEILNRFSHLTYAPATEQSRLMGAGAGLTDND